MNIESLTDIVKQRFWAKVQKDKRDVCWPWIGARNMEGYGIQVIDGKQIRASRIALTIKLGRSLNALALHTCDNPGCVNPDHLYEGTAQNVNVDTS